MIFFIFGLLLPLTLLPPTSSHSLKFKKTMRAFATGLPLLLASPCYAVLNDPEAFNRFKDAKEELVQLDRNWESVVKSGGDGIRRKLGTVYSPPKCVSPLCSFPTFSEKFVRQHFDDIDMEAFEEPSAELLEALNQADFLAYSSVFADYGNGGGGVDYIDNSRVQVKRALSAITQVVNVLSSD
jgi:hypothetical protein